MNRFTPPHPPHFLTGHIEREKIQTPESDFRFKDAQLLQAGEYVSESKDWRVQDLWGLNGIGWLTGEPKTGKTWLAIHLALSIASGKDFLGAKPVRQGRVLMSSPGGNRREFHNSVEQAAARMGLVARELPLNFLEKNPPTAISNHADQKYLLHLFEEYNPDFIIFDPLEKNHQKTLMEEDNVLSTVRFIENVRARTGCSFMMVHNGGGYLAAEAEGWTSFGDGCWFLEERENQVVLTAKVKNEEKQADVCMRLQLGGENPGMEIINQEK